jgi:hypothetical protein
MKKTAGTSLLPLVVWAWLGGAGCRAGVTISCQDIRCPMGGKVYRVCVPAESTVATYTFDRYSCTCDADNVGPCSGCANKVAAYCASGGDAGGGDGGDASGADGSL